MRIARLLTGLGIATVLAAAPAQAIPVTALPSGTIVPMPAVNVFGAGPESFGAGITWSSTNDSRQLGSVFGYTGTYGFSDNGFWDGSLGPMAGLNSSEDAFPSHKDTMTFAFATPVIGVGGFLNYVPGPSNPTVIAIYDSGHNLLESYDLTFLTGNVANAGEFHGFLRTSADIRYFTLTDNYVGIANLTVQQPVPEPGTLVLLGAGLFGLARRRRRA